MRRVFSCLFLILFLYNIVGYYPVFLYFQSQVKDEVYQKIKNPVPQNDLTVFVFDGDEYKSLEWVERNEFRYKGNLYDVVRKKTDGNGNIVVEVLNDKKEKELIVNLKEQTQQNTENPATGKGGQKLPEFFSNLYLPTNNQNSFIQEKSIQLPCRFQSSLISCIREIPSPPPRLV
ncbi:MAG: hypothetical protein HYU69_04670 [Bacteroidetes bacterium]|nr:hypothetical protein [Bacteroidota bacterium]